MVHAMRSNGPQTLSDCLRASFYNGDTMKCIYSVKATKNGYWYDYPCGQCAACRITRRQEWVLRIMLEMRLYEYCYFVTLTYNNDHLPTDGELVKSDLQNWFKRLRKLGRSFRYFACGEYGEKFLRPHYHVIIMSNDDYEIEFARDSKTHKVFITTSNFHKAWTINNSSLGIVDVAIIPSRDDGTRVAQYVAGYSLKKLELPVYEQFEQQPFTLMSRKPGIGLTYVDDIAIQLKQHGAVPNCVDDSTNIDPGIHMVRYNGKLWPIGRTLRNKLLEALGGDKRSDLVKTIGNNRSAKLETIRRCNPEYDNEVKEHLAEVKARAEKKVKFYLNTKRRNPGSIC